MNRLILLPLLLPLAACGGRATLPAPEPIVVVKEVKVPVAAKCVPETYVTKRPDYVDDTAKLRAAADAAERYQLLWGGRAQRIAREKENEVVIAGCAQ